MIAAIPDAQDRQTAESAAHAMSTADTHIDLAKRKVWFSGSAHIDGEGDRGFLVYVTFLENGNVIQISGYADAKTFSTVMPTFQTIGQSVGSAPVER
jgi:hypothetical protein